MSLSDFLEKLQNKPRPVRVFILWVSVTIGMTIIFVLWLWSMNSKTDVNMFSQQEAQETEQEFKSPAQFKKEIPSVWESLKASMGELLELGEKESLESGGAPDNVPPTELP